VERRDLIAQAMWNDYQIILPGRDDTPAELGSAMAWDEGPGRDNAPAW
jgi:hypothetical protein